MNRSLTLILASLTLCAEPCRAQEETPTPRRWTITGTVGGAGGGPARGLATQLRASGWDDTSPETCFFFFCSERTTHPIRRRATAAGSVNIRYDISPRWAVALGLGNAAIGGADGYQAPAEGEVIGQWVRSAWSDDAKWLVALFKPVWPLRIGVGPSIHGLGSRGAPRLTRAGITFEAGIHSADWKGVLLDLSARRHVISGATVAQGTRTKVMLSPDWGHFTIEFGVGVRFGPR